MSWYSDWFDSKYYHRLYKRRDEREAEFFINNLINKIQLKTNSKLIDIACGKGRHATYFNKKGMNVVGIDLSKESIAYAKRNENSKLKFIVHDMRDSLKDNHFDIATNLFTSFGYFEDQNDNQKCMNAMSKNLKKDGLLVLDFMNVIRVCNELIKHENKIIDNTIYDIRREIKDNYIIKNINITEEDKTYSFQEKVKILELLDFDLLFKNAKLSIVEVFGNYTLDTFHPFNSDRLIMIAKKTDILEDSNSVDIFNFYDL